MPRPKIFFDLESLYAETYDRVKNFPKLDKHLLGKELLEFINEAHKACLLAVLNPTYLPFASANFDLFKKALRIAVAKKLISEGWYCSKLEIINSIGQEIGGWLRKTKTPKV